MDCFIRVYGSFAFTFHKCVNTPIMLKELSVLHYIQKDTGAKLEGT